MLAPLIHAGPPVVFGPRVESSSSNPEVKKLVTNEPSGDRPRAGGSAGGGRAVSADARVRGEPEPRSVSRKDSHAEAAVHRASGPLEGVKENQPVERVQHQPQGCANAVPMVGPDGSCEVFYIGDGPQGVEPNLGTLSACAGFEAQPQVNPFWSPARQQEAMAAGFAHWDVSGGSQGNTPQKNDVVMDPIELFRIRCLREAEEKFMQGISQMYQDQQPRMMQGTNVMGSPPVAVGHAQPANMVGQHVPMDSQQMPPAKKVPVGSQSQASQGSYVSARDDPQNEPFIPKPPPGPPPPSPPRVTSSGCVSGMGTTPVPPPPPPLPQFPCFAAGNGTWGENPSENLRTVELPRLSADSNAIQFGDWLSVIGSLMGDLSYTSSTWLSLVRGAVNKCYQEWLVSGPMERLRLKPTVDPQVAMWPRTERRALAMLMAAVPDHVKNEVVASRMMSTDQLLFKLFICFQPGGASERTKVLHNITDGKCGTQVSEMLDWLRVWRRNVQRAVELHVTLPDGLVLMGALSKCSDNLSQKSAQVAYRLNMVRSQLGVDHQPVMSSILSYAEYMQAEAEELQLSMPSRPSVSAVKVAAMNIPPGTESKPSEAPKKECKFWMSDSGCRRGDQCKFQHARLDPQSNRCFLCSAVGHTKKECPVRNADTKDDQKKKAAKVKAEGKHEKGSGEKGQKGGKAREDKPATPVAVEVPPGLEGSDQVDGLITEATTLLKSLAPTTTPM